MAKTKKDKKIKDEPGADERFGRILKRALNTPLRKPTEEAKAKRGAKPKSRG